MDDRSKMMKMEYLKQQKKQHILTANQADSLFEYIDIRIQDQGCDHTHRFTLEWLTQNISADQRDAILAEIEDMGGFCDCEVLLNCYEDY